MFHVLLSYTAALPVLDIDGLSHWMMYILHGNVRIIVTSENMKGKLFAAEKHKTESFFLAEGMKLGSEAKQDGTAGGLDSRAWVRPACSCVLFILCYMLDKGACLF